MDMLSNVFDLNDKMTKMTVLLGSAALIVLIIKNNEKALTSKLSNSLLLLICAGTLLIAYQINEEDELQNSNLINDLDNSSISDLSNGSVNEGFQDTSGVPSETGFEPTETSTEPPSEMGFGPTGTSTEPPSEMGFEPNNAPTGDPSELEYAPTEVPTELEYAPTDAPSEIEYAPTEAPTEAPSEAVTTISGMSLGSNNYATVGMNNVVNKVPEQCFPKDIRDPSELLPKDKDSAWAKNVPAGQGELNTQNFLNAGHHLGVNTVGQSLRNANRQLRSEPPNPQVKVSPWLQSTIEPDINRRGLDIGTN